MMLELTITQTPVGPMALYAVEGQLVGCQPGQPAEEVTDVGVGTVEALGGRVDLGAVAGRE